MDRWQIGLLGAALAALLAAGCGGDSVGPDGETVGGPCSVNADCDERCATGGDFPDGTCTVSCDSDVDCPDGSACVTEDGGICLQRCDIPDDCRDGYNCEGEENKGHGGDSLVCIAD
jgi:hypothetical protein